MSIRHWVTDAQQALGESLFPVPHELNELDWKASISDNKDRLAEHLAAFANRRGGGTLAFGVANDGSLNSVVQSDVEGIVSKLANLGRDALEPAIVIDHTVVAFHGVNILLVHVPEQPVKPVHRRGKSIEETWVRSGGTTRKASRQDVGSLLLNSATPKWEEQRASDLLSIEAIEKMLDLPAIGALLERPLPRQEPHFTEWLIDEGIVIPDGRGFYISNFGAVAAAMSFEDFPSLERKRIRLIRYRGTNKVDTIDEIDGKRGYAVGFEGLIAHLNRVLPHSEVIQQSLRTNVAMYPEIALRELIANALIHQDFTVTGAGPTVEIYDDRIEITNPGTLLPGKKPDRLIGTTPESRNEKLASAFRRYRICEERGTGFQKIVSSIELFGLPPLKLMPQENAFRIALGAPRKFADMSSAERVEACYQHAVLQCISSQTLTNTTLRKRFQLHDKNRNQVTNLISDAVTQGRIKRKDEGAGNKFAEYVPYWA